MQMTLEDAKYCLSEKPNGCTGCKFNKQDEIDCRGEALKIGVRGISFLIDMQKGSQKIDDARKMQSL